MPEATEVHTEARPGSPISSHLVTIAARGMETGALTAVTIGPRELDLVLDRFELITGLLMNHAFVRPCWPTASSRSPASTW